MLEMRGRKSGKKRGGPQRKVNELSDERLGRGRDG